MLKARLPIPALICTGPAQHAISDEFDEAKEPSTSSSKIERSELESPSVRRPGSAGDRVVDYLGPDEDEEQEGTKSSSFSSSSDQNYASSGGEHRLVQRIDEGGNLGASRRLHRRFQSRYEENERETLRARRGRSSFQSWRGCR